MIELGGQRLHGGHAILLLLAVLVLFLGVRAAEAVRAPVPPPPAMIEPVVADRALLAGADPFFATAETGEELPVTALPLSLHGVRAETASGRGTAIIALADGAQTVFATGEQVTDGVVLVGIAIDHVVLDRSGVRETLWMANAGGGELPAALAMASQPMLAEPPRPPAEAMEPGPAGDADDPDSSGAMP
jgi:general secretion pathway protein C